MKLFKIFFIGYNMTWFFTSVPNNLIKHVPSSVFISVSVTSHTHIIFGERTRLTCLWTPKGLCIVIFILRFNIWVFIVLSDTLWMRIDFNYRIIWRIAHPYKYHALTNAALMKCQGMRYLKKVQLLLSKVSS